jgi:hypothetical protein
MALFKRPSSDTVGQYNATSAQTALDEHLSMLSDVKRNSGMKMNSAAAENLVSVCQYKNPTTSEQGFCVGTLDGSKLATQIKNDKGKPIGSYPTGHDLTDEVMSGKILLAYVNKPEVAKRCVDEYGLHQQRQQTIQQTAEKGVETGSKVLSNDMNYGN